MGCKEIKRSKGESVLPPQKERQAVAFPQPQYPRTPRKGSFLFGETPFPAAEDKMAKSQKLFIFVGKAILFLTFWQLSY